MEVKNKSKNKKTKTAFKLDVRAFLSIDGEALGRLLLDIVVNIACNSVIFEFLQLLLTVIQEWLSLYPLAFQDIGDLENLSFSQ